MAFDNCLIRSVNVKIVAYFLGFMMQVDLF